jgi:hypothetical protein
VVWNLEEDTFGEEAGRNFLYWLLEMIRQCPVMQQTTFQVLLSLLHQGSQPHMEKALATTSSSAPFVWTHPRTASSILVAIVALATVAVGGQFLFWTTWPSNLKLVILEKI